MVRANYHQTSRDNLPECNLPDATANQRPVASRGGTITKLISKYLVFKELLKNKNTLILIRIEVADLICQRIIIDSTGEVERRKQINN